MVFQLLFTHPQNEKLPYPLQGEKNSGITELSVSHFVELITTFPGCGSPESLQIPLPKPPSKAEKEEKGKRAKEPADVVEEINPEEQAAKWYTSYLKRDKSAFYFQDPSDPYTFYLFHPVLSSKNIFKRTFSDLSSQDGLEASLLDCQFQPPMLVKQSKCTPYISIRFVSGSSNKSGHIILYISQTGPRYLQNLVDAMALAQVLSKRFGFSLFRLDGNQWKKVTAVWYNEKFPYEVRNKYLVEWLRRRSIAIEKQLTPLEWPFKGQIDVVSEFFKFKLDLTGIFFPSSTGPIEFLPDRDVLIWMKRNLDKLLETRDTVLDFDYDDKGKRIHQYAGYKASSYTDDTLSDFTTPSSMVDDVPSHITLTKYKFYITHRRSQCRRVQVMYNPSNHQLQLTPYHASTLGRLNRFTDWNITAASTFLSLRLFLARSKIDNRFVTFNDRPLSIQLLQNIDRNMKETAFEFYLWWRREIEMQSG